MSSVGSIVVVHPTICFIILWSFGFCCCRILQSETLLIEQTARKSSLKLEDKFKPGFCRELSINAKIKDRPLVHWFARRPSSCSICLMTESKKHANIFFQLVLCSLAFIATASEGKQWGLHQRGKHAVLTSGNMAEIITAGQAVKLNRPILFSGFIAIYSRPLTVKFFLM